MYKINKLLFTPGPLLTSDTVKKAMQYDMGSRDEAFTSVVSEVREKLLTYAEINTAKYTTILFPGSGTYSIEAVLSSCSSQDTKWLLISNGYYANRMCDILNNYQIPVSKLDCDDKKPIDLEKIELHLKNDSKLTHLGIVHCETSVGLINDIHAIGTLAKQYKKTFVVDAMSSFGAVPIDFEAANISFLVSSANKCLEGVPGLSFVIAQKNALEDIKEQSKSFSLDLYTQWKMLEESGEFRFTPPVQVLLAMQQALHEWHEEGGAQGRRDRYATLHEILVNEMEQLGFKCYLPSLMRSYIITTFYCPTHPKFFFKDFYNRLSQKGFIIYTGKISKQSCFRIGNMGRLDKKDIYALIEAIKQTRKEMGF